MQLYACLSDPFHQVTCCILSGYEWISPLWDKHSVTNYKRANHVLLDAYKSLVNPTTTLMLRCVNRSCTGCSFSQGLILHESVLRRHDTCWAFQSRCRSRYIFFKGLVHTSSKLLRTDPNSIAFTFKCFLWSTWNHYWRHGVHVFFPVRAHVLHYWAPSERGWTRSRTSLYIGGSFSATHFRCPKLCLFQGCCCCCCCVHKDYDCNRHCFRFWLVISKACSTFWMSLKSFKENYRSSLT